MDTCIIVFSHSNYIIKPTGVEKCIRELSDLFIKAGTATIQVFSMYNRLSRISGRQLVGINYCDQFLGIYEFESLPAVIEALCEKHSMRPIGIHIHHLINFDLSILHRFITTQTVPTVLFIHDYYTVCTSINMIDSSGHFCGVSFPSDNKCNECMFFDNHSRTISIRRFLKGADSSIHAVIVPSGDAYTRWISVYPEFKTKTEIRGHLSTEGRFIRGHTEGTKIKIAFIGSQLQLKGYDDWRLFVDTMYRLGLTYELHYFGYPAHKPHNVINHIVSTATGGSDAMTTSLRENDIDFVFLWSQWPETYSFVYFEASAAGSAIITNPQTGNVAAMVASEGNGKTFSTIGQAIRFFSDERAVSMYLEEFLARSTFAPLSLFVNTDVTLLLASGNTSWRFPKKKKKISPLQLHSLLYACKHKIAINKA